MRVTISKINEALKAEGIDAEIVRAEGYFYFEGPAVERAFTTSVMTNRLGGMTISEWVAEAQAMVMQSSNRWASE